MKSNVPQQIIFDLDDTLIHCNKYFNLTLGAFYELMQEWFCDYNITIDEVRSKQIEIDVSGVNIFGFASQHFPQSLIDTYVFFSKKYHRAIDQDEQAQLQDLGMSVYEQEVEAYPGMVETLELLRDQGHTLHLYTGGEHIIQQRKIDQMKLGEYFDDRIYITKHKNIEALEAIIQKGNFDRSVTWMIGNSLRTDIEPAISAGIHAIYIEQDVEWQYNVIQLNKPEDYSLYTIKQLVDVPDVIQGYLSGLQN
ncbi:HAD family hydrolase [Paenibacillus provencensis]|uniref:HAD family hydrolase n=1 Tax=Paenibacillus provencensis TaxID=441151 RepID=A0ABW3PID7_9BACL|nr:HAD family hydrolase [Paenibacillus sp. MER 78]MCM3126717.1 HAD family hydrolase [Paenibacillus sp. MER 78]